MGRSETATVLFTDVVGSTELLTALGDVAFDDLRRRIVAGSAAAVEECGGRLVKSLGDGVMATFVSSVAAMRAGVAIQQQLSTIEAQGRAVELRVGMSVGDVITDGDDAHGEAVVEAARLCGAAAGGQVLCTELVVMLSRGQRTAFDVRPVGELSLKGLPDPVQAFEVRSSSTVAPQRRVLPSALAAERHRPLVGRERELRSLGESFAQSMTARTAALVVGEPGVGKTRLVAEAASTAHDEGAMVLLGRCVDDLAAPFAPWVDVVEALLDQAPPDALHPAIVRSGAALAPLVPEVGQRLAGAPAAAPADPATERRRIAGAIDDLVTVAAAASRLVIVLDDLHWSDEASCAVLTHLLRPGTAPGVVILGTYRDTDIDRRHPFAGTLGMLRRSPNVRRVHLTGFDRDELAMLVGVLAEQEPDPELVDALCDETEGNPFFVIEVLAHLAESGAYEQRDGRWIATRPINELGLPEGVREVIGRRLSQLSEQTNAVLRLAAIAGLEFELTLLDRLDRAVGDDVDILRAVEEATRAGLLREATEPAGRYRFTHALIRQTLLEELSSIRRARGHWAIGDALSEHDPRSLDEIAFHLGEGILAGDANRALDASLAAGQMWLELDMGEKAAAHLERASWIIETFELDDPERQWRALTGLGQAYTFAVRTERVAECFMAAIELAERSGWHDRLIEAITRSTRHADWAMPADRLLPVVDRLLAERPGPAIAARLLTARVVIGFGLMALDQARDDGVRAVELARAAGDPTVELLALERLFEVTNCGVPRQMLTSIVEDIRRCIDELGGPAAVPAASSYIEPTAALTLAIQRGDRSAIEQGIRHAEETFVGGARFNLYYWRNLLALADGRLDDAMERMNELIERFPEYAIARTIFKATEDEVDFERGVEPDIDEQLRSSEVFGPIRPIIRLLVWRRELEALATPPDRSAEIEEAMRLLDHLGPTMASGWALMHLAEIAARLGRADWARALEPQVVAMGGAYLSGFGGNRMWPRDRALAQIFLAQGRFDDAVTHAEAAVAQDLDFRANGLLAKSRLWLARTLLARAEDGDADQARRVLNSVRDDGDRLGLVAVCREAESLRGPQGS